jgi:glycosyltransferase involved in cell wall biosynthesis
MQVLFWIGKFPPAWFILMRDITPLLSIVTPCLNRADFVADAIESVLAQNFLNFEHIIVDGGSTDGTLAVLQKYPHLKVISEPDSGLYDALNKGIRMAKGEVIGLLNTDDLYAPNVVGLVLDKFDATDADIVIGAAQIFEKNKNDLRVLDIFPSIPWADEKQRWERLTGSIITNAWFFRREVFVNVGLFEPSFRIASDRDFLWRVGLSQLHVETLEQVVYCYRSHSGSLTMERKDYRNAASTDFQIKASREVFKIIERFLGEPKLSRCAMQALRNWYAEHTYLLAFIAVYHVKPGLFLEVFWRGCKNDIRWPYYWLARLVKRVRREF